MALHEDLVGLKVLLLKYELFLSRLYENKRLIVVANTRYATTNMDRSTFDLFDLVSFRLRKNTRDELIEMK